jgi:predicted MFS family arabinose efflux permease
MVWMLDGLWLFPAAFGLLVASRIHGIARNALLPIALDAPAALVAANGRLATISVIGGTAAAPVGALAIWLLDSRAALVIATLAFLVAALSGRLVPRIVPDADESGEASKGRHRFRLPRTIRLAQLATAVVRVLNGFLLLLLAFAFKDRGGGILDLGAVLVAGGGGFFIASLTSPALERRLREEPMVVAGLAVEAAAAFIAGQWFGLPAAAFLAAAAGFAWGTAKLAFDGLLQFAVPEGARGSAFTRSETLFQLAWVAGAFVPTALPLPTTIGLVLAGLIALTAQVVYVSHLLTPLRTVNS